MGFPPQAAALFSMRAGGLSLEGRMTSAVRTGLLVALASVAVSCGGGGSYSPPPPPPPSPPTGPAAPPTFTSPAAVTTRENMIGVVYRPVATDPNGDPITYSAIGGPDAARFTVNPVTREVRFTAQPDFEAPGDAGGLRASVHFHRQTSEYALAFQRHFECQRPSR